MIVTTPFLFDKPGLFRIARGGDNLVGAELFVHLPTSMEDGRNGPYLTGGAGSLYVAVLLAERYKIELPYFASRLVAWLENSLTFVGGLSFDQRVTVWMPPAPVAVTSDDLWLTYVLYGSAAITVGAVSGRIAWER